MLTPNVPVQWLDVASQTHSMGPIEQLFQQYSILAKKEGYWNEEIIFPEDQIVKITDWQGWTDILGIRKTSNKDSIMVLTVNDTHHTIRCSADTLIPTYQSPDINRIYQQKTKGFNGELRYPFIIKKAIDLVPDDRIRCRNISWWDGREHYAEDGFIDLKDAVLLLDVPGVRYQVITRSGFYNANEIYMWGQCSIPDSHCAVCPVYKTENCTKCRQGYIEEVPKGKRDMACSNFGKFGCKGCLQLSDVMKRSEEFDNFMDILIIE